MSAREELREALAVALSMCDDGATADRVLSDPEFTAAVDAYVAAEKAAADEIDALRAENARLTERERIVDVWGSAELRGLRTRAEAAEAKLAAVEALDPDDLGHGLFCASHYDGKPCDCWGAALAAALTGDDQAAEPKRRCGPFEEREHSRKCLKCGDVVVDFADEEDDR